MTADMANIAAKLRAHNIRVTTLDKPMRVEGESFAIKQMRIAPRGGYDMGVLDGAFTPLETREFPAGSFYVDMAQPMANAAFYYLEPQARDGFVGWRVLDEKLRGVDGVSDLQDAEGDPLRRCADTRARQGPNRHTKVTKDTKASRRRAPSLKCLMTVARLVLLFNELALLRALRELRVTV